jgi:hypothetical protein
MKAFGRFGDRAADELFEHRSDRGSAVRADFGYEMEGGVGHRDSSP